MKMRMIANGVMEVHFGLRPLDLPQTTLFVIIIPVPENCDTCSVGQVTRATLSKTHPRSG